MTMARGTTCCTCDSDLAAANGRCEGCGRAIHSTIRIRRLGWAQLLIGMLLTAAAIGISIELVPWISDSTQTGRGPGPFTGTPEAARSLRALLGLMFAFALTCAGNGVWQIRTGRRSKLLLACAAGLLGLLVITGWSALSALGS